MASNNMMQMATEDPSALVAVVEAPEAPEPPLTDAEDPPADVGTGQYGLGAKSPMQVAKAVY